jgi:tyrosyl-tRNA synthetase
MNRQYKTQQLIEALQFNTQEAIPSEIDSLSKEVERLVIEANTHNTTIRQYIGFEISGEIHIGTGIMSALKIKQFTDAGVECVIWLADYHTWLNGKLDGNIETIRKVAREYFAPTMLECCKVVGCDMRLIKVLFAEEEYNKLKNNQTFWNYDLNVCKSLSLSRVMKSISVTGKSEGDAVDFGTLRYAPMQVADAFFLQTHIVSAGMDQRKCHVLMREIAYTLPPEYRLKIGVKEIKPIASHHYLLHGLGKPVDGVVAKMSKSKPETCIFVYDGVESIRAKLKKAYAPMIDENLSREENDKLQELNPLLDWARKMIFPAGKVIQIKRKPEWGGDTEYTNYQNLHEDYINGKLHPSDLKNGVGDTLIEWFKPLREYTSQNQAALDFLKNIT